MRKEESVAEVLVKRLSREILAISRHCKSVRNEKKIDARHDMRVAIRKLDAMLSAYGNSIDPDTIERELDGIARVRKALGKVRDLDLFITYLKNWHKSNRDSGEWLLRIIGQLEKRRKSKIKALKNSLYLFRGKGAGTRVRNRFRNAILPSAEYSRIEEANRELLPSLLKSFYRASHETKEYPHSMETWHMLRIQGKYVRYTLEAMRTFPAQFRDLISHLKQSQDSIGTMHDCSEQLTRIDRIIEQAKHPAATATHFAPIQNNLHTQWEECRLKAIDELPIILKSMKPLVD